MDSLAASVTLLISSVAAITKMILWQSIKSLSRPEHHKANILLFLAQSACDNKRWRWELKNPAEADRSGKRLCRAHCYSQLWPAVASIGCISLGEVCNRTLGKAGVMRAFSLQEWQPWGGDEGVRAEDVYSVTWHLLRENILSRFKRKQTPKLKWIRHS